MAKACSPNIPVSKFIHPSPNQTKSLPIPSLSLTSKFGSFSRKDDRLPQTKSLPIPSLSLTSKIGSFSKKHDQLPQTKSIPIPSLSLTSKIGSFSRKDDQLPQYIKRNINSRRNPRNKPRPLITISTSDGKWHGQWTHDYIFSLSELKLADLAEDGQKDADVSINLCIQKHAGFGFSVDGRIMTAFTRKCSVCSSLYCREIRTTFDVWVLPSGRVSRDLQLPEIGGDDPSVIYVKPGSEADLDSLIQDTIRLTTSVKDTCSESCEKSPRTWNCIGGKEAYVDKRWSRLMEIRNAIKNIHVTKNE